MRQIAHHQRIYLRILEVFLLIATLALALPWIARLLTGPKTAYDDDFAIYWVASRLAVAGQNPYNPALLPPLYRLVGHAPDPQAVMWNPPWTMVLFIPLAILPYPVARTVWFFLQLTLVAWSLDRLGRLVSGDAPQRWLAWFIGFTFYPVTAGLQGQVSVLTLAGTVGLLLWMERRPLLAGMAAAMLTVKPHTTYLILLALLWRAFSRRQWNFFLGCIGTLLGSLTVVWIFHPTIIAQYLDAWSHHPPAVWATATLGGLLRLYFGPEHFALQFVVPLFALCWLAVYGIRHRSHWVWEEQLPLIAVVSSATAAYGWTHDPQPALVGVLPAILRLLAAPRSWKTIALLASYGLIQIVMFATTFDQLWYFWLGPTLLLWFLLARWHWNSQQVMQKATGPRDEQSPL